MGLVDWLEQHLIPCQFKQTFGVECPSCGMQRAIIHLLKGEIIDSIIVFPALLPMMLMICFLIAHLIFKIKNGTKILLWMFIFTTGIMIINFCLKIIL